ncbi:MAG: 2-C-methyl-D-erythritol 2,4-cyclodiphosphate synthase [Lentisphaeria bacterium]|nr:2-C-methyl-D-erythritol 2,4-cyclodiphosphate synthase [Lentisphaeria bacterium]
MDIRIGQGYDSHRFTPGRDLILCGEKIPFELGLAGHSDADAPVHALIDALLGALALGDIGHFFPDSDPRWKDADSLKLLRMTLENPAFSEWKVGNADLTIITQKPKLAPHIESMRKNLAAALTLPLDRISVKAKTNEGMGFTGRLEGLEAQAAVLLFQKETEYK